MKRKPVKMKLPKERNFFAVEARLRPGSGVHEKPYKAKRKLDKQKLNKYTYA